jgi:acetylornithine/N-succinyldiaminopimelate aminotransferase
LPQNLNRFFGSEPAVITSVLPVYNRSKLQIQNGEGVYLNTTDGRRYLDFVAGVAVNCLGHCHPKLVEALEVQARKLWQISNYFQIPGMQEFADLLTKNSFADTVFFCNSGAESIECAIKMMRKYHDATGNPDKYRIITFTGAFHGRTLAAIWASKRDPMMQEGFGPPVEGFDNAIVDEVLNLKEHGLKSVSLMYVGYADPQGDWIAPMKKVRIPKEEFLLEY